MSRVSAAGVETSYVEAGGAGPTVVLLPPGLFGGGSLQGLFPTDTSILAADHRPPGARLSRRCAGHAGAGRDRGGAGRAVAGGRRRASRGQPRCAEHRPRAPGRHDEGALLAVRLAFQAPHRVISCTIVDSPAVAPSGDGVNSLVLNNPLQPLHSPQGLRWVVERVSASPHHLTPALIEAVSAGANARRIRLDRERQRGQLRPVSATPGSPRPPCWYGGSKTRSARPHTGAPCFDIIAVRQPCHTASYPEPGGLLLVSRAARPVQPVDCRLRQGARMIGRRTLVAGGGAALMRPSIAQPSSLLRFVPQANLTSLDPVWTTANVTRHHGYLVYDTLYGLDHGYVPRPQMAEGTCSTMTAEPAPSRCAKGCCSMMASRSARRTRWQACCDGRSATRPDST